MVQLQTESCRLKISPLLLMTAHYEVICFEKNTARNTDEFGDFGWVMGQAFAWAFVSNQHTSWEHFAVYWIGPMVGTVVSVWAFNLLFAPKRPVQKGNAAAAVNGESDRKAEVVKDGSVRRRAKRATQEESAKEE